MMTRKPLREANMREFIEEIIYRLEEMSTEDLERVAISAEQILWDRDVDSEGNKL